MRQSAASADGGTVGVVGTGTMGRPMAINLARAGYSVRYVTHDRASVEALDVEGCTGVESLVALAESPVILLSLPDGVVARDVLLGADERSDALVRGLAPGALVIDTTTCAPEESRDLAHAIAGHGGRYVDAPVSGGQRGAIAGTLTIMAGGSADDVAAAAPVFAVIGAAVTHVGEVGAGQVAKLCNQLVVAGTLECVAEALVLARQSGVDPSAVRNALLGGFAQSRILEAHGQRMIDGEFTAGFRNSLQTKDLALAASHAQRVGVGAPLLEMMLHRFMALSERYRDEDHSSLIRLVAEPDSIPVP